MAVYQLLEDDSMSMLRSIRAIVAGLVFIFATHMGADHVMHTTGVFPPYGEPMTDSGQYLIALSYRIVFSIIGCYLAARLAPRRPMLHALILGGVGILLVTAGAVAMWGVGPAWYPVALIVVTLPSAWLGGRLYVGAVAIPAAQVHRMRGEDEPGL